ncbi:galactokinase [Brooklawnia cerclae]|uniref:Galactokinase n=1 Tax=Brooklawnia cerclae TaxID=349934 RepID=A0ABX0SKN6_9ACTN|nr:galactokinase [Brooklawnia cerclae]NIH57615.1 galactokinase [Brooklawnia cerclae]
MVEILNSWSHADGAARASALFRSRFDTEPDGVWAAPGRVNVIGEHVDYNGGPCLPIALPHRTYVALRARPDDRVRLTTRQADPPTWEGRLADIAPGLADDWVAYAAGAARVLLDDGYPIGGFDAAIDSCVPLGAGLSSSAAIECAVAIALDDVNRLGLAASDQGRARLAGVCARAENEIVGAPTGGMDQAASLRTADGKAILLDTLDNSVRQVPLGLDDAGLALLVIDTRAHHALVDGQYAARRRTCEQVAARLGVRTLREVADPQAALATLTDDVELRRVRHVFTEIARVGTVVSLVEAGRVAEIGPVLDASHASLRDDYEVSCPELDVAVEASRAAGALGARMTGGGFGGSAIALVPSDLTGIVMDAVAAAFGDHGMGHPAFLVARAAGPAERVAGSPVARPAGVLA